MNLKNQLQKSGNNNYIRVKITPNSSKNEIFNILDDGTIKIRIKKIAEKGKVNKELISFLAKELSINKDKIKIISGATDQIKLIKIGV